MARNPFKDMPKNINESPRGSFPITPDNGVDLPLAIRQVTIGTSGGVIVWMNVDGVIQATGPLPVGTHAMAAHRILVDGTPPGGSLTTTTATGLTGWV